MTEEMNERQKAAQLMGQSKSKKKMDAIAENAKIGGRPIKALNDIVCDCGATDENHTARCQRGRAIAYRKKHNLPLLWTEEEAKEFREAQKEAKRKAAREK